MPSNEGWRLFMPSGCRLTEGLGKFGIKTDGKGREVEGRSTSPTLWVCEVGDNPLASLTMSQPWADASSLLHGYCYSEFWVAVISFQEAQCPRWKSPWHNAGALHSLFCPFFLSYQPHGYSPLLATAACWAVSRRQLLWDLISEVIANLVPFTVRVEPGYFLPMCLTLLSAALNASCHFTTALGAPFLAQPQLFTVGRGHDEAKYFGIVKQVMEPA